MSDFILPLGKLFSAYEHSGKTKTFPLRNIYISPANREWLLKEFYLKFYEHLLRIGWQPLSRRDDVRMVTIPPSMYKRIRELAAKGNSAEKTVVQLQKEGWQIVPSLTGIKEALSVKQGEERNKFPGATAIALFFRLNYGSLGYLDMRKTLVKYVAGKADPDLFHIYVISKKLGIPANALEGNLKIAQMYLGSTTENVLLSILKILFESSVPLSATQIASVLGKESNPYNLQHRLYAMCNRGYLRRFSVKLISCYGINGHHKPPSWWTKTK